MKLLHQPLQEAITNPSCVVVRRFQKLVLYSIQNKLYNPWESKNSISSLNNMYKNPWCGLKCPIIPWEFKQKNKEQSQVLIKDSNRSLDATEQLEHLSHSLLIVNKISAKWRLVYFTPSQDGLPRHESTLNTKSSTRKNITSQANPTCEEGRESCIGVGIISCGSWWEAFQRHESANSWNKPLTQ